MTASSAILGRKNCRLQRSQQKTLLKTFADITLTTNSINAAIAVPNPILILLTMCGGSFQRRTKMNGLNFSDEFLLIHTFTRPNLIYSINVNSLHCKTIVWYNCLVKIDPGSNVNMNLVKYNTMKLNTVFKYQLNFNSL